MTASLTGDTLDYVWRIEAGERERLSIPVLDEDDGPADLTGYIIDAQIKAFQGGAVLYTFPAEHITVEGSAIVLLIPAPVSVQWPWRVGWWRVLITAPDPDPDDPDTHRIIAGPFIVSPD